MQKEEKEEQEYLHSLTCPSFNCYSNNHSRTQNDDAFSASQNDDAFSASQNDDTDFEFAAFRDETFWDDLVFPLFNSDVRNSVSGRAFLQFTITGDEIHGSEHDPLPQRPSSESSSSEELEAVPAGIYSVWRPNSPEASPGKCKKSNSTGTSSSRKWKLLDLLRRSNSEGKESSVLLKAAPEKKKVKERWSIDVAGKSKGKGFSGEKTAAMSAHEALYVRNREVRMVDKKKSFLPYKPGLVGFCTRRFSKAFPSGLC